MNARDEWKAITRLVLVHFPDVQAIYLFGSYGTDDAGGESDVDIALLLPPADSKQVGWLEMSELRTALESALQRDVDLINLRRVSTVLQKEVVAADCRIYEGNRYAAEEFEMLTLSFYGKLNEERAEIVASALADGRFHDF